MANCPVCSTEYLESEVKICSICGWDLTPYPLTFAGQIPQDLVEKERKKLAWAKQIWLKSQLKEELDRANQEIASLQSRLQQAQQVKVNLDQANQKIASLESELELTVTRQQLDEQNLEKLKILNQTLETQIQSLKQQLESSYKKIENQGDAHEKAIPFYEQAINLDSTTLKTKLEQAEIKAAEIKHLDLGNGVILELVKIPAGSFKMGGDHSIHLEGFFMGKYPVTQKQYQQITGENPSYFKGNNLPVQSITWHDAVKFCEKVSQKTGRQVTLASETQWEYAARAGTTTEYFFGNRESQLQEYGWYNKNSERKTHPVGAKKPNLWGLYDLLGNVWEWCQDDWDDDYHNLPKDGSPIKKNNKTKVLRGGSWYSSPYNCRCGFRNVLNADDGNYNNGCRVIVLSTTLSLWLPQHTQRR